MEAREFSLVKMKDPRELDQITRDFNTLVRKSKSVKYLPVSLALVHGVQILHPNRVYDCRLYVGAVIGRGLEKVNTKVGSNTIPSDDKLQEGNITSLFLGDMQCSDSKYQVCYLRVPETLFTRLQEIQIGICREWRSNIHLQYVSNWLVWRWLLGSGALTLETRSTQDVGSPHTELTERRWFVKPVLKERLKISLDVRELDKLEAKPNGGNTLGRVVARLCVPPRTIER